MAVVAAARLAMAGAAEQVIVARWRPFAACPFLVWLVLAAVEERFVAVVGVAVGLVVVVTAGATGPRAGMGHHAPCRVMGRAAELAFAAGFPARFE